MSHQIHTLLTGLNHRTAAVELRERLAFDEAELGATLGDLLRVAELDEAVILSTCNRTEIYAVTPAPPAGAHRRVLDWLAARAGVEPSPLEPCLYQREGAAAVDHLLSVAAGLDSLVLGEPQILGQVRAAVDAAVEAGATGPRLSRLGRAAIETGKQVRSSTALGAMPVSVASVAVQLVERVFGDLSDRAVLVVGAGEICSAAALHLTKRKPERLVVVNRTAERAERLADRCCGLAAPWDRMDDELCQADVVLTSTGAPEPLITRDTLAAVMQQRRGRAMLLVDVAVPRDVDPAARKVNNVYLYDVDDLQQIAVENMVQREAEVPEARRLVTEAAGRYLIWEASLEVVPTIVDLRTRLESIRSAGVAQYMTKLPDLDDRGRRCIEQMTQTIINRILHEPQVRLRHGVGPSPGAAMAESLRYLFALDSPADDR